MLSCGRQSGGNLGGLRDSIAPRIGSTDHRKWFTLWNPKTGDITNINGVMRRNFRLHPVGERELSEGCITLVNPAEFELLQRFIRRSPPLISVPGSSLKAYGTVEVR
ncbi:tlde1 domain-containing protein [Caballeronia catudaia]|uniref:tlde1 domain-containing protein n=1 Tax=Caballeronia catudaia TaxID=1777136 RepID=UPI003898E64A